MGLRKEVQEYFINLINEHLEKRMKALLETIDVKAVNKRARELFYEHFGGEGLLEEWNAIEAEVDRLEERKRKISIEMENALKADRPAFTRPYWSNMDTLFKERATNAFQSEALSELFPTVSPDVEALKSLQHNVKGAVLLATTETKLVKALNSVLNNFGGDMTDLLALLPNDGSD